MFMLLYINIVLIYCSRDEAHMRRFFKTLYMDSVFPILNSAKMLPYIWGNAEEKR